jgi:hypothetical protein
MPLTWSSRAFVVKIQKGSRNYKVHTSNRAKKLDTVQQIPKLKITQEEFDLSWFTDLALQRKFRSCIPFLGIARPQPKFPHSWVCERFLYSQDWSTYSISCSITARSTVGIYKSLTDTWLGNWDWGRAIPSLGIFVSNFRYSFFAVWITLYVPQLLLQI